MPTYGDAIKEHAKVALNLYKNRIQELETHCGLKFMPDGSCAATAAQDVQRYLQGIKALGGLVSYTSAKMVIGNAIHKLGLPPVAL